MLFNHATLGVPMERSFVLHYALGMLHKTHRHPVEMGPSFWWVLLADLTGISLILWAFTGLATWWQMKKLWGLVVLISGQLLAGLVFWSVLGEKTFGNVRAPAGPGRAPPITQKG